MVNELDTELQFQFPESLIPDLNDKSNQDISDVKLESELEKKRQTGVIDFSDQKLAKMLEQVLGRGSFEPVPPHLEAKHVFAKERARLASREEALKIQKELDYSILDRTENHGKFPLDRKNDSFENVADNGLDLAKTASDQLFNSIISSLRGKVGD